MQFSVEESGCYVYCGTDSGDIVKLVVTVAPDDAGDRGESVGMQVQTCAVMKKTGRVGGGKKDVNAGKFAGGASNNLQLWLRESMMCPNFKPFCMMNYDDGGSSLG